MNVKALKAFTVRDGTTGTNTSYACGQIITGISSETATAWKSEGLVEDYTLITPTGSLEITENGTYDVTDKAEAVVAVPTPSGSLDITENGTYDVTDKAEVIVNVSATPADPQ